MNSRSDILGRIRAGLGRKLDDEAGVAGARDAIEAYLAARQTGPQPRIEGDLAAHFCAKSAALASTVVTVAGMAAVPQAISRYLAHHELPPTALCWPELAALPWREARLQVKARGVLGSDPVGITGCFCAIAETGTLMLCSGPDTPAALSLLPETHIAIVPAARIVPTMEDAWHLARSELMQMPRAINFISGPSRTGDIEMAIVLGAHGPYRVHIIIVAEP